MTSTYTKLEIVNNALNSIGERGLTTTANGILGNLIISSLQDAIYVVCNSAEWRELRSVVNASSWSADSATMPDRTYRVRECYWYTSPDGTPDTNFDYAKYIVKAVPLQDYETRCLVPYTDASAKPLWWCRFTNNVVKVNPYPNDATERSKLFFEVYRYIPIPSSDTSTFECSDLLLNLIQYKLTELLALKHLNDVEQAGIFKRIYTELYQTNMVSDGGVPSHNMYRSRRR